MSICNLEYKAKERKLRFRQVSSCIRPEDPVQRAHCSAVILYVFFAILAKSQFLISINNPTPH
jgi:hypothetical protein